MAHTPILSMSAAVLVALVLAACGRDETPDLVAGKQNFIEKCSACHALARAGGGGTQGPDLDQAFAQARRDGMNEKTVEGVVVRQIAHPRRNSIMPADLVTGDTARDVAAYVAEVAGQPGEDTGPLAEVGAEEGGTAEAENGVLQIDAVESGALAFTASEATAPAGRIEFVMENPSPIDHNIALEDGPEGDVVGNGGTSRFTANLKPGEYMYLCTVPGHAEGGMVGDLTVE
ncbi:MAG TPA: c-type cytochrome [Thermoleophilaceae bacterium]|nr:c-type cytochrome [Thermoleophilaceae bacterium]